MPNKFTIKISAVCFLLFSASILWADDKKENTSVVELPPIIISAVRSAIATGRVADNVVIYSKERIKTIGVHDLSGVLSYVPGVDVSVGSRLGQATSLSIHGSNSRDVLVMVDDIPFNTQLSGQANPSRIPIENIERVEIIKGAASSAWGSSLGGVINVITKDVGDTVVPKVNMTSSYGTFATVKNSVDLAGKAGPVGYYFMDSLMTTHGMRTQSSSVREEKVFSKFSVPLTDEVKLTQSFGYSGAKVEDYVPSSNKIYHLPYLSRYGKLSLDVARPDVDVNLAYKYNDQDTEQSTYNATTGAKSLESFNSNVYHGISLNTKTQVRDEDLLVVGSDFEWTTIKSNNYLNTSKDVLVQAPYANYTWKVNRWDLIPGIRFDNNNRFGNQLSPSFGTVFHFEDAEETLIRAKVSRAFNAPPLLWRYQNDPTAYVGPNFDLKPERAMVYEVGTATKIGRLGVDVDYFRQDVQDGLVTVMDSVTYIRSIKNVNKIRRQGGEVKLTYKISEEFKAYVSNGYNHAVNRTTDTLIRDNGVTLQNFGLGLNYLNASGLGCNLYAYRNRWDSTTSNDRKVIYDAKLLKKWKNVCKRFDFETFLNVYNLTNSRYWSDPAKPIPGRYFEGGVTISF